jgi:hypothetical protein
MHMEQVIVFVMREYPGIIRREYPHKTGLTLMKIKLMNEA